MRSRRRARAGLALLITGLLLAACGGGGSDEATTSSTSSAASTPAATESAAVTTVTAVETEFSITLTPATLRQGTYLFKIQNNGKFPHNLTVEGPGVDKVASPTLQSGQSGELRVTLQQGTYEFWCSVDAHKDKGMAMKVQVGQSTTTSPTEDSGGDDGY